MTSFTRGPEESADVNKLENNAGWEAQRYLQIPPTEGGSLRATVAVLAMANTGFRAAPCAPLKVLSFSCVRGFAAAGSRASQSTHTPLFSLQGGRARGFLWVLVLALSAVSSSPPLSLPRLRDLVSGHEALAVKAVDEA